MTMMVLMAVGITVVVQNLLMVRITTSVSTVLITLVINYGAGLAILLAVLIARTGGSGIMELIGAFQPWIVLPGLPGSFFAFAEIVGYQKVGAASTVAVLVASQLVAGLLVDEAVRRLCRGPGTKAVHTNVQRTRRVDHRSLLWS